MPAMPRWTRSGRSSRDPGDEDDADREVALRILLGDEMMSSIARTGRFRVVAHETQVAAPPDPLAGHRLAWLDLVDYERDRSLRACVDLDRGGVASLRWAPAEPRLAPEEEADALEVALADRRVAGGIALGDAPQVIVHAGKHVDEHRSAAVVFGDGGTRRSPPSLIAVVDLWLRVVTRVERRM
jgi:hypothetical protein